MLVDEPAIVEATAAVGATLIVTLNVLLNKFEPPGAVPDVCKYDVPVA
jgi:hypothetical protein